MRSFKRDRCQKPVVDALTRVLNGFQCRLPREQMQVTNRIPAVDTAQYSGGARIQGNVVDLPSSLSRALTQKAEAVLDVLDHIQHQGEVKGLFVRKRTSEDKFTAGTAITAVYQRRLRAQF